MLLSALALALTVVALITEVSSGYADEKDAFPMIDDDEPINENQKQEMDQQLVRNIEQIKDLETKAKAAGNVNEASEMRYEKRKALSTRQRIKKDMIKRMDYTKFKSAAESFKSIYTLLTSDNADQRAQAVFTFLSSLADIVPGPIGALLGTALSIVSSIFSAKSPSQTEQFQKIIETEFQEHQFRNIKGELEGELKSLDRLKYALKAGKQEINRMVDDCSSVKREANTSMNTDDADAECFDTIRLTRQQLEDFTHEVQGFAKSPMLTLGKIKSFVLQDSEAWKGMAQLDRTYRMLLMYVELQSALILGLEEYSEFIDRQDPTSLRDNITRLLMQKERDDFAEFGNEIANPKHMHAAYFAHYIMFKNETNPVLDSLARKLAKQVEHKVQGKSTFLFYAYPCPVELNYQLSWVNPDSPALGLRVIQFPAVYRKSNYMGGYYSASEQFVGTSKENAAHVTFIQWRWPGKKGGECKDAKKVWSMAAGVGGTLKRISVRDRNTYLMGILDVIDL